MERDLLVYGAGGAGRELAFSLSLENKDTIDDTLGNSSERFCVCRWRRT